jgi:hypothetical protein
VERGWWIEAELLVSCLRVLRLRGVDGLSVYDVSVVEGVDIWVRAGGFDVEEAWWDGRQCLGLGWWLSGALLRVCAARGWTGGVDLGGWVAVVGGGGVVAGCGPCLPHLAYPRHHRQAPAARE